MSDGVMRVMECTQASCVIHSGGSRLGLYGALIWVPVLIGLTIGGRYSPWLSKRIAHGWAMFIPLLVIGLVIPALLSGETNTITLSKEQGTLQIATSQFFVFRSTKKIDLGDVLDAANIGRYNQLRVNLRNGDYVNIGNDTVEGGRANAADAINQWLSGYRGEPSHAA